MAGIVGREADAGRLKRASSFVALSCAAALAAVLVGCQKSGGESTAAAASTPAHIGAAYAVDPAHRVSAAELAAIGRAMFFDPSLSASGRVSCASCHDPAHGHAPANALPVQLGGANGRTPGLRNAPTLRYLQTLPPFSEHHRESEGDDSVDAGPTGGHTWGRAAPVRRMSRRACRCCRRSRWPTRRRPRLSRAWAQRRMRSAFARTGATTSSPGPTPRCRPRRWRSRSTSRRRPSSSRSRASTTPCCAARRRSPRRSRAASLPSTTRRAATAPRATPAR